MGIVQSELTVEMEQSFIDYSLSVIIARALPDVRDGLKPVHRRFIWGMEESGNSSDKAHRKCARIVGDTMGKYHPHGDTSIYGALVRFSQPWAMRYPLVDFHGNNGSQDGDGAAAMRYTEARLSKIAEATLADIKKDVIDFVPNFSEDEMEPVCLPGHIPNLLINPTEGIAVGMACSFAPHNIVEMMNAIIATLENEKITIEELMGYISGPDFPTGGILINKEELLSAYKTGKGRARVRGKYVIEGKKGDKIVFSEIPYGVMKEPLIEAIVELANSKKIEGISDVYDHSDKSGMRLTVELAKDANADLVVAQLFKYTRLEDTYGINQVCIVSGEPLLLNLKQLIENYLLHQKDVYTRKTKFELQKALARLEITNGLLIALEDIDNVIALIRQSSSAANAKENLEAKYNFTKPQSQAIVDLKLGKLARLEKVQIQEEQLELSLEVDRCNDVLSNVNSLKSLMINEFKQIITKFGDARRTEITQVNVSKQEKEVEFVKPEDVVVVITKSGNIKKIPSKSFKIQNKNGKGIKNQDDVTMDIIRTNTIDTLMVFSNLGKMYRLLVDTVPVGTNISRGVSIKTLVNMDSYEEVMAITSLYRETKAEFAVFVTKKGIIKKTTLDEYMKAKRTGIIALKLKEDDSVSTVTFLKDEPIILISKNGMSIKFETKTVPVSGRNAIGVKGMELAEDDIIIAAIPVHKDTDELGIFTENGMGRKTKISEFPMQNRAGKGTIAYKPTQTSGVVKAATLLDDDDIVLIIGDLTSICIKAVDIPSLGKISTGNILIKNNRILVATKL